MTSIANRIPFSIRRGEQRISVLAGGLSQVEGFEQNKRLKIPASMQAYHHSFRPNKSFTLICDRIHCMTKEIQYDYSRGREREINNMITT